jgi:hypothetical protein
MSFRSRILMALLALRVSPIAAADASPAAGAVTVRVEPPSLEPGAGARATILVDAGSGAAPAISASAGRIEDVRPLGEGRYAATYVPPPEAYPRIAIVTALAADGFGWAALRLVGRGLAIARSSPGASIVVEIGGRTFGPARADRQGEARVPVAVPPGAVFAYHRGTPLDLEVPPSLHVHLAAGRAEARADAAAEIPVVAIAVAPDGTPRAGAPLELAATQGELRMEEVAAGTFVGTWRLPAGPPGDALATARLADEPASSSAVSLSRPVGPPARLEVAAAERRVSADSEAPVRLRVGVTDAAGNPVPVTPRIEASVGTVSAPGTLGAGTWEATLELPRTRGVGPRAEVTIRAADLEERVELELVPGAPVRLEASPEAPVLVADGATEARIRVSALDRLGNPVPVARPEVQVARPAAVSAEEEGAGWLVRVRPRRAREDGTEVVSLRAGALESVARIGLVAPERRLAVAPRLGVGVTTAGVWTPHAGAEASYRPALGGGRAAIALELGWLLHERTDRAAAGTAALPVHGRARYAPLLATASWLGGLGRRWVAGAAAGAGLAHVTSEVSVDGQDPLVESGWVPAAHASVACGVRLGHGMPFLEVRALRNGDPGFRSLHGSLTVLSLSAGYRYAAY